jgi:hypothetical protein
MNIKGMNMNIKGMGMGYDSTCTLMVYEYKTAVDETVRWYKPKFIQDMLQVHDNLIGFGSSILL